MLRKINKICVDFARDEEGLALTEYLILLGLLTGGVIIAVLAIGNSLSNAWGNWQTWFADYEDDLNRFGPVFSQHSWIILKISKLSL